MWLFFPQLIIFLFWPLMVAVALLLLGFLARRRVFKRMAVIAAAMNVFWIIILSVFR